MIDPARLNPIPHVFHALQYLKNRLCERSTWLGISTAIAGANALNPPWSYASVAVGVIMALTPSTKGDACPR